MRTQLVTIFLLICISKTFSYSILDLLEHKIEENRGKVELFFSKLTYTYTSMPSF